MCEQGEEVRFSNIYVRAREKTNFYVYRWHEKLLRLGALFAVK